MNRAYQICTRCVMDTTDPQIEFDAQGYCNHCTAALERMRRQLLPPPERDRALQVLVDKVKADGKGKRYDCIIGISGGIDSTTTAYMVKKLGLRPLAVHLDNGWNSELAVDNIKTTLDVLNIPLYTYVIDWEEFRDLLLSFMRASVSNCEMPTDHAITATLFRAARRERLRYILSGSNIVTEAIVPITWAYHSQDLRHLKALHRRFGMIPLRTMPTLSLRRFLFDVLIKKTRQIPFLNYIEYNKQAWKEMLARELGWRDYGGKHYESVWTRFFQGYYLPTKFGYDKRKSHLSTLICSGQMTRDEALAELEKPAYDPTLLRQDMPFVLKKLGLTEQEFEAILRAPAKLVTEYPSHHFLLQTLRKYKDAFRAIATGT
jgi:N-acetyl sugar amidotransferase